MAMRRAESEIGSVTDERTALAVEEGLRKKKELEQTKQSALPTNKSSSVRIPIAICNS